MKTIKSLLVMGFVVIGFVYLESLLLNSDKKNVNLITVGDLGAAMGSKNDVPPGGISVLDFEKQVPEDMSITTVKFYSNADENKVRLKIWRLKDDAYYEVVAKSKVLSLVAGLNVFEVDNIEAKKGDFLGVFMASSEIDRSTSHRDKGRFYVVGDNDVIPKNTVYKDALTGYTFLVYGLSTAESEKESGNVKEHLSSSEKKQVNHITVGDLRAPIGSKNDVPPGGISVLDFEKQIPQDMSLIMVKFYSNASANKVRLKIWRLKNTVYEVVAKSDLFQLASGFNSFEIDNIEAKKGDFLGVFMESNEIDRSASHGGKGRVYVVGDNDVIPENTVYKDALAGYTFLVYGMSTTEAKK